MQKKRHAKKRTAKKIKIVLREDERILKPTGSIKQKNYSVMKNDKVVGSVILDYDLKEYPRQWEQLPTKKTDLGIASINIEKKYRGKGIGGTVLKKIATVARKSKRKRVVLVVYGWNSRAKKFYKEAGYEEIGKAKYLGKREKRKSKRVHVMAKELNV
jgi:ribosomal protein S18 acetylase RimI-like enzyme